jgi:two-component system, LytTR family, response regulator
VKIRTVLVEDEPDAMEHLEMLLTQYCENVAIVGKCTDVKSSLTSLTTIKPDLVIMDIRLPDGTAFDILNQLKIISFNIIFTTAYSEYAIKAFKISAIDYLLKPIDIDEMVQAIDKAEQILQKKTIELRLQTLLENVSQNNNNEKKILLNANNVLHVLKLSEIIFCQSINRFTHFFLTDGREIATGSPIREYEMMLSEYGFFRTGRQFIINMSYVKAFNKTKSSGIMLVNGFEIPVSVRRKEQLIRRITSLSNQI